jgi:ABC-2 type transport system ATP-binding protein
MKRRVLVAQALVHKPPVIVLDEPTAGVDVELRQGLWQFVRRLNRDGHTIILTTHYLEEAEALCGRIACSSRGGWWRSIRPATCCARFPGRPALLRLARWRRPAAELHVARGKWTGAGFSIRQLSPSRAAGRPARSRVAGSTIMPGKPDLETSSSASCSAVRARQRRRS